MITGMCLAVLTEDAVCHLSRSEGDMAVVKQWTYHARMYRAARFAAGRNDLELVQLTSLGCGIDAITCDAVQEILESHNKVYTLIKIDEISNLGAAQIRLDSLKAAMRERQKSDVRPQLLYKNQPVVPFTKEMKETYTILAPQMPPVCISSCSSGSSAMPDTG